jgi:hypothetical protein
MRDVLSNLVAVLPSLLKSCAPDHHLDGVIEALCFCEGNRLSHGRCLCRQMQMTSWVAPGPHLCGDFPRYAEATC